MRVDVKLFAAAREAAGAEQLTVELPESARVDDLRAALAARCPRLAPLVPGLLVAVGSEYARDECVLSPESEVACFPPVSGG